MSYKLFNERIASAIENHKDHSDWASIEDRHFTQEVFSGSYNEKNLEQLKSFIKRHNQSFIWKEEGASFWVKIKNSSNKSTKNRKKKCGKVSSVCKRLVEKVVAFFKYLFPPSKKRKQSKDKPVVSFRKDSSQKGKNEKRRSRGGDNCFTTKDRNRSRKKEGAKNPQIRATYREGKQLELSPQRGNKNEEKYNRRNGINKAARGHNKKFRFSIRLSDFASFSPYKSYLEACEKLLPLLSENVFTISLSGDFDQLKINLPVYLSRIYSLRVRKGEVVQSGARATFHTGLYDRKGNGVYISFKRSDVPSTDRSVEEPRQFEFDRFVVENSGEPYQELCSHFSFLPSLSSPLRGREIALEQLYFDPMMKVEMSEFFLVNNLFYLPDRWLDTVPCLQGYKDKLAPLKGKNRIDKMHSLSEEVMKDKETTKRFMYLLEEAINEGLRKLRRNPRLAIPAIDTFRNKIFLLLPLSLEKDKEESDVMLELYATGISYRCTSLSSLSKAMLAIRTLASLPDNWLQSNFINNSTHTATPKHFF